MTNEPTENRILDLAPEDHLELNRVLGTALGVAREQLEANGVFLPFGIALETAGEGEQGELRLIAVQPPETEDPEEDIDAEAMMADLIHLLVQQREGFTAIALVSDVTLLDEGRDAVHVNGEHATGGAVAVVQAYTPPAEADGEWTFDAPAAEPGELHVWR